MRIMLSAGWRGWHTDALDPDDDRGFLAYPLGEPTLYVVQLDGEPDSRFPDPRFPDDWRNDDRITERTLNDEGEGNGYAFHTHGQALLYWPLRVGLPELTGIECETLWKQIKAYHAAL